MTTDKIGAGVSRLVRELEAAVTPVAAERR